MHRPTVGILAVTLLLFGGGALVFAPETAGWRQFAAVGFRVGLVLGAIWLALPDARRPVNRWIMASVVAAIVLVARFPKLVPLALLAAAIAAILKFRVGVAGPRDR